MYCIPRQRLRLKERAGHWNGLTFWPTLTCALMEHKDHHSNNRALEIFAWNIPSQVYFTLLEQAGPTPEAVHVCRCRSIHVFKLNCLANLLSLEFGIDCRPSKMGEDSLCILIPTFAHQPPRGLGRTRETDQEDDRENPLDGTERTN